MPPWPDIVTGKDGLKRCGWCGDDPLVMDYHDREWGVPVTDDQVLFEFLLLEGAQAGLSWITVLRKREAYREAFFGFDPLRVADLTPADERVLLHNPGLIRNRLKIASAAKNAQAFLKVRRDFGSFAAYAWSFTAGKAILSRRSSFDTLPTSTPESLALSRDLKRRGFTFVGGTIAYAYMQAVGMAQDHLTQCHRHRQLGAFSFKDALSGPPLAPKNRRT
jgi:DNA-3-methyladenine glycosylase I